MSGVERRMARARANASVYDGKYAIPGRDSVAGGRPARTSAVSSARRAAAIAAAMCDYMLDVRIRAAGGWRGFAVIEPRDSLIDRHPSPDPWEQFAKDVERELNAGRSNRAFIVDRDSLRKLKP